MHDIKVLFLSSWFPNRTAPLNGDFIERQAIAVSNHCKTIVLHVAADDHICKGLYEIQIVQKQQLQEIILYFKKRKGTFLNHILYTAGYIKGYLILLKQFGKPDLIHANIIYPISVISWIWKKFTGVPYIISEHWTLYLNKNIDRRFRTGFIYKAVIQASALVPVTRNLQQALMYHGFTNDFHIIPNVVDTDVFKPAEVNPSREVIRILHVSSMKEDQKNISGILRTIKRLWDIRQDFVFTFVGSVNADQGKLACDLGLTGENVVFAGEKTHPEVAAVMKQSHMLVMFSRTENLPCVIVEAVSCGLPVISTNVGGINEWISSACGVLIDPENETALLNAMIHIMDHPEQFDRVSLHQFACDNFSNHVIAAQLTDLYTKVLYAERNA